VGSTCLLDRFEGTSSLFQWSFQRHSSLWFTTVFSHRLFEGTSKLGNSFLCAS
jgi:hypothetical protein